MAKIYNPSCFKLGMSAQGTQKASLSIVTLSALPDTQNLTRQKTAEKKQKHYEGVLQVKKTELN